MAAFLRLMAVLFSMLAAAPALAAEGEPLPVQEVASGVFVYAAPYELADAHNHGAIANIGFVVGDSAVAVVDTGGSLAEGRRLLAAIRARTALPIRYVINTHVHPDHTLGNAAFAGEGATFVGHANLPDAMAARAEQYLAANRTLIGESFAGTTIVPPALLVRDRLEIDLGNRVLLLEAWSTAHTNSDLTVFDQASGTWFLADLLFVGHMPSLDGSLRGWIATLARLRQRSAARAVPGHGPASCTWPACAEPERLYLDRLAADTRRLLREGRTMQEAAASAGRAEAGDWQLFDDFAARNAVAAFHELEWE